MKDRSDKKIMVPFLISMTVGIAALLSAIAFAPDRSTVGDIYQLLMMIAGIGAGASIAFIYQYETRQ